MKSKIKIGHPVFFFGLYYIDTVSEYFLRRRRHAEKYTGIDFSKKRGDRFWLREALSAQKFQGDHTEGYRKGNIIFKTDDIQLFSNQGGDLSGAVSAGI